MYCHATLFRKNNFPNGSYFYVITLYFSSLFIDKRVEIEYSCYRHAFTERCRALQLSCQTTCFWVYFIDPNSDEKFKFIVHDFEFDDTLLILKLMEIEQEENKFRHDPEEEVQAPGTVNESQCKNQVLISNRGTRVLPKFSS